MLIAAVYQSILMSDLTHDRCTGLVQNLLQSISDISSPHPYGQPHRAVFCNRTLNLRSILAVGFDLDYTLLHYQVEMWEGKAYGTDPSLH